MGAISRMADTKKAELNNEVSLGLKPPASALRRSILTFQVSFLRLGRASCGVFPFHIFIRGLRTESGARSKRKL